MTEEEKKRNPAPSGSGNENFAPEAAESASFQDPPTQELAEELERDLSEARSKANTYLDLAQRTQADFVNYKRRVEQERSDYARASRADIILRLLGPLDDLDRALESLPANLERTDWVQGVKLIDRKFHAALEALGVRPLEVVGKPFDPYQEESVAHEPSTSVPEESVTRIVRPGYAIDGRVIRPAQVIVSSGPPEDVSQ